MRLDITQDQMAQLKKYADAFPEQMKDRVERAYKLSRMGPPSVGLAVTEAELVELDSNLEAAGTSLDVVFGASVTEVVSWFDKEIDEQTVEVLAMILSVSTLEPRLHLGFIVNAARAMATVIVREVLDDPAQDKDQNAMVAILYVARTMSDPSHCMDADDTLRKVLAALKVI